MSDDGEYEWFETIQAEHLPRMLSLLGAECGDDILDVLEQKWSGPRSYELERVLARERFPDGAACVLRRCPGRETRPLPAERPLRPFPHCRALN